MSYIFAEIDFWDYKHKNRDITKDMKLLNSMNEEELNKLKYKKRLEWYFDKIKKRLQKHKKLEEKHQFENVTNQFFENR